MVVRRIYSSRPQGTRGIATLELVMCMPVLLMLMVGIVWLGYSVIGQSAVTINARHQAWQRRFGEGANEPLRFLEDDFATEESTTEMNVSPIFADVTPPESSHDVAMGLWDSQAVDLNSFPNWQLYVTAAANAKSAGLQNTYSDARNELQQIQDMAGQLVIEEIQTVIREMLENPLDLFEIGAETAKAENESQATSEIATLERKIADTQRAIERTETHIDDLQKQKGEGDEDQDQESLEFRIEVAENKVKRLKSELSRLKANRKELD